MNLRRIDECKRYWTLARDLESNVPLLEEKGDFRKACEALWGAAVNYTKALLALMMDRPEEIRSWRHKEVRDGMKKILLSMGEDPQLVSLLEALHANFYEGFMDPDDYLRFKKAALKYIETVISGIEKTLNQVADT